MVDDGYGELDPAQAPQRHTVRVELDKAAAELQARRVAHELFTDDLTLAQRVNALGFTEETARVFDLLPMIHVAWADDEVQRQERRAILAVLEARKVPRGSPAYTLVTSLLESRPGPAYMDETLAVLRELVATNNRRAETLVDLCIVVAEAHGAGFWGLRNPIDEREKAALYAVATALGERAHTWLRAKFGELG